MIFTANPASPPERSAGVVALLAVVCASSAPNQGTNNAAARPAAASADRNRRQSRRCQPSMRSQKSMGGPNGQSHVIGVEHGGGQQRVQQPPATAGPLAQPQERPRTGRRQQREQHVAADHAAIQDHKRRKRNQAAGEQTHRRSAEAPRQTVGHGRQQHGDGGRRQPQAKLVRPGRAAPQFEEQPVQRRPALVGNQAGQDPGPARLDGLDGIPLVGPHALARQPG